MAGDGESCPDAARLWDSAFERLPLSENESVLRHLTSCGACAASWRLARELRLEDEAAQPVRPGSEQQYGVSGRRWWVGLAAAAMVVLVAGIFLVQRQRTAGLPEATYRAETEGGLVSEIADTPLPREGLVLRWSGAPPGTTYDLRVTSDRLEPLHRVFGLEAVEYRIPADTLSGVPPGGVILWNVTAHLADGRQWTSRTFRAVVE
jgi:hypothetical protein